MHPRFQKITSCLLAILIFYNAAGYFVSYLAQKALIRNFVEELFMTNKAELEVISLSVVEFAKYLEEESDEIYYHDNIYDVAYVQKTEAGARLYCYKDVKEKDVVHHLGVHLKNHGANRNKAKNTKIQLSFFTDVVFSERMKLQFNLPFSNNSSFDFHFSSQFIPGCLAHPPEHA